MKLNIRYLLLLLLFAVAGSLQAQNNISAPEIGAQIWLEPGQKPEDIDNWFKTLADNHMPVTRLFMMWNFMEQPDGKWDYSLYDAAFKSAEAHKVKIVATLMPNFGPPSRGFFYKIQDGAIPKTEKQLQESEVYVKNVVQHYANSPALDTWMLMNEPGQYPAPDPLALSRYTPWLKAKYGTIDKLNAAWLSGFKSFEEITYTESWSGGGWTWPTPYNDWCNFWREHLTWYMNHVNTQIQKYDTKHLTHVNPHGLLDITSKYDLPGWSQFLGSLGASIHPVWHFGILEPKQYTQGISYVCDMIRGSATGKPFWVTELQGGHNIYTGNLGIRPTPAQIRQWVWTSVGSGAGRVIFWCLNPRGQGTEAGEWAMLNYQNQTTDRFNAAAEIAATIQKEQAFFTKAEPLLPDVTILLSIETMQTQERSNDPSQIGARKNKAHKEAVLGVYRALQMNGISPQVTFFNNYVFLSKSMRKRVVIVPHATALTDAQIQQLTAFAQAGNKVIITGLTGLYNENEKCRFMLPEQMKALTGGLVKEVAPVDGQDAYLTLSGQKLPFAHFACEIDPGQGQAEGTLGNLPAASRYKNGRGEVVWLPACVDIFAFETDATPLAAWLKQELQNSKYLQFPFGFQQPNAQVATRIMVNGYSNAYAAIVTNSGTTASSVAFNNPPAGKGRIIAGNPNAWQPNAKQVNLDGGETIVLIWEK